jgi:hypothetical protein
VEHWITGWKTANAKRVRLFEIERQERELIGMLQPYEERSQAGEEFDEASRATMATIDRKLGELQDEWVRVNNQE